MPNRIEILLHKLAQSVGLPFQDLLPESDIIAAIVAEKIKYRNRLFSPIVTIWAFLSQVLDTDKSLQNVVSRVIAWLAQAGEPVPSTDTGGYRKARIRLPEGLLNRLFGQTAQGLEEQAESQDLWCGRHVKICDGSSVLMSDTKANQAVYPQHSNQAKGCGFPIAKIVVVFSLTTGAVMDVLIAAFKTSVVVLARQLYHNLLPGDVLLKDRAFGSYVDLVLVQFQQADALRVAQSPTEGDHTVGAGLTVFRKHQSRKSDFRAGQKTGYWRSYCNLAQAPSPSQRHDGRWKRLHFLTMFKAREVHLLIRQQGFRPKEIILVTTLVDPKVYTKAKLAQLYQWRWEVELDLRHVKTTLGMEMLRGKTPEMVRKEIYVHLLAYNLLRSEMWEAGKTAGVSPLGVSLQGTRQHLGNFISKLADAGVKKRKRLYRTLLQVIAHKLVPHRPGRLEPRVKKLRPKAYGWMQQPRSVLKRKLAA